VPGCRDGAPRCVAEAVEKLAYTSVELALEITRCLLRAEIPAGRYDLEAIVRESLSLSGAERGRCVVHLNPVDAEAIADVPLRSGTELEPDPNVPRGSVHVTTPQGLLVRDLEEAVKSIGERILGDLH
jgi:flagellar biosynthesis/type III secretory pathway protein FliH